MVWDSAANAMAALITSGFGGATRLALPGGEARTLAGPPGLGDLLLNLSGALSS